MSSADLALQEDEGARLGNDMAPELGKQEVDHVDIALVDLRVVCLEMTLRWLGTGLSGAEDICEKLHDDCLSRRDDVLGSVVTLVKVRVSDGYTYSDSLKA